MRLIDADALKAEIQNICDNCWHPYMLGGCPEHCGINDAVKAIDSAPTVDAVPVRHGRWIDIDSETYTWKIRCSKCGHERSMMSTGQTYPMYCEDCGARMDGEGNGNETD